MIAVDPRDPNRVWAARVEWFRSDDGGRNWGLASYGYGSTTGSYFAHADQHAITFHPNYDGDGNQIVLIGNDGNIFRTTNARAVRVYTRPRRVARHASMITVVDLPRGGKPISGWIAAQYMPSSRHP